VAVTIVVKFTALTSEFLVELPGIEPAANILVTSGNAEFDYGKRRGVTCGYAERC